MRKEFQRHRIWLLFSPMSPHTGCFSPWLQVFSQPGFWNMIQSQITNLRHVDLWLLSLTWIIWYYDVHKSWLVSQCITDSNRVLTNTAQYSPFILECDRPSQRGESINSLKKVMKLHWIYMNAFQRVSTLYRIWCRTYIWESIIQIA